MNPLSKRVIGIDEDWDNLLSSGVIVEGDSEEGIVYVTDGEKWGAMDWQRNPIIPVKYDRVELVEFQYSCFHFVCKTGNKYDIYNGNGTPIILGANHYNAKHFFSHRYFLCLANSYKRGGRCIAGIEMYYSREIPRHKNGNPRWIRPIAETQYGEIPNHVANNINLLSFVELEDGYICPDNVHTENVRYLQMEVLPSTFSAVPEFLNQFVDNIHHSIFGNRGKAVSVEMASELDYSLMFIHVQNAKAYVDESREKSRNRMRFIYLGSEYDFPITDPVFLDEFRRKPECFTNIPDVYLTLSLGLEFEGWHHKLVAGVIIPADSKNPYNTEGVSYMEQQKQIHHNAYSKWTTDDDDQLKILYEEGVYIQDICSILGRNEGAIRSRISKLGLDIDISTPHIFDKGTNSSIISQHNPQFWFVEYEQELVRLLDKKNEIEEQINEVRSKILQGMESHSLDKISSEHFSVSYTPAKTIMQFDSRAFRTENEELYFSYCKPKQREASIVVKRIVKEQDG